MDTPERGKLPFVIGDRKFGLTPMVVGLMLTMLIVGFVSGFYIARSIYYHPGCSDRECQKVGLTCNLSTGKCE